MSGFFSNWIKKNINIDNTNKKSKMIDDPRSSIKPRIEIVINNIQLQISKLDARIQKIKVREEHLFYRVVDALRSHDTAHLGIFSNELAQLRRNQRTLNQARIGLEQVSMRISTMHDLGEIMEVLKPAMKSSKGLKSDFEDSIHNEDAELNYMQMLTNCILSDSNQNNEIDIVGMNIVGSLENDDVSDIMVEASEVAKEYTNSNNNFS